ncbi:MAG: hypothetical protein ACK4NO_00185 [Glycocaulis sp.]
MTLLAPKKLAQLRALMRALPEGLRERLVEAVRAGDETMGRLLDACSKDADTLARERMFAPLAPLSRDPATARPSLSHAPPAMLATVWNWISETLVPDIAEAMRVAVGDPLAEENPAHDDPLRAQLAEAITQAVAAVSDDPRGGKQLRHRLGVADFRAVLDVAVILRVAPVLREAMAGLPDDIGDVTEELSQLIRDRYDAACARDPDSGVWFLYLVMARLRRPWAVLRVFEKIARRGDDFLLSRTDVATIGDALLEDAAYFLAGFADTPGSLEAASEAAGALASFAQVTVGMTREIGIRKDGGWGQQIMALRQRAAQQMEAMHAEAVLRMDKAVPDPHKPVPARLKLTGEALEEAAGRAETLCVFMRLTRDDSSRAAAGGSHAQVMDRLMQRLDASAGAILALLRNGSADEHVNERAAVIARLMTALGQQEPASIFLRRTAAARAA